MPQAQQICIDYLKLGIGADALGDHTLPVGFSPNVYVAVAPGDRLEHHLEGVDNKFDDIINTGILVKTGVTPPVGITVPDWLGQIYHDTAGNTFWLADGPTSDDWSRITLSADTGGDEFVQEEIAAENISGDQALTAQPSFAAKSDQAFRLYLNGQLMVQGVGRDYTVDAVSRVVTWLNGSGTAPILEVGDTLVAFYPRA